MNSYTSSLSSLEMDKSFPFLAQTFNSITWSHIFLISILSLVFFLKTWIYLWNLGGTNFLVFSLDFTTSSSLSQISYSFTILFTSIFSSFFSLFFFLSCCFFLSCFFFSSSFCFYYSSFPYFGLYHLLHSSKHLVIFTSSILQSILGLW